MNLRKVLIGLCIASLGSVMVSCNDEDDVDNTPDPTPVSDGVTFTQAGTLQLNIAHAFNSEPFNLSPTAFVTAANDTIRVTQLSYYVSNIVLTDVNGKKVPLNGYFLQEFLPGKPNKITLQNVPAGTYKSISYLIGVDSLANSTGSHTGDLDPSYGMYWTWSTGYVFFRIKGRYSAVNSSYSFDIGGTENGMLLSHNLLPYKVSGSTIGASLKFDLARVFNAPNTYDLKVDPIEIHGANDPGIGKFKSNIESAITITSIQ